jgi:hypothetical protein
VFLSVRNDGNHEVFDLRDRHILDFVMAVYVLDSGIRLDLNFF